MKMYKIYCLAATVLMLAAGIFLIVNGRADFLTLDSEPPSSSGDGDRPQEEITDGSLVEDDYLQAIEIQGRGKGFYADENGRILLSLQIKELSRWIKEGRTVDDYQISLRMVVKDRTGKLYFAYPVMTLPIDGQDEDEFSVLLADKDMESVFCPTVGRSYHVEVTVMKQSQAVLSGQWTRVSVALDLGDSQYYDPTVIPSEEERRECSYTVRYSAMEGGQVEGNSVQTLVCGEKTETVRAVPAEGYLFWCWSDGVKTEERSADIAVYDKEIYAMFTKDELDPGVPNLYIETPKRTDIISRQNYVSATITVKGAAADKFNLDGVSASVRCRGNSTYSGSASSFNYNSRNSYRIKFDEKLHLLGVGSASNRDWVLHANKYDASNLRNYFIWTLAREMGKFSFVPSCAWVNLYINGDYRGVYMITEQIEVADGRIDIDDSGTDPDKDYLVELDMRGDTENGAVEGLTYFYLPGFYDTGIDYLREWVIKSEVNSTVETAFIKDYFIRCHNALLGGKEAEIDKLVDIDSIVDMLIVQELSKDVDGGGASIYWVKEKGGKLKFTAPWDYDFGLGSYGVGIRTDEFVCEITRPNNRPNLWLQSLLKQQWFLRRLYDRMLECDEMVTFALKAVRMQGKVLTPAADRNDRRWQIYARHYQYHLHRQVSKDLDNYQEHVDFLCNWIEIRWQWMMTEIEGRLN